MSIRPTPGMHKTPASRERGYSLVEVLTATGLTGMIVVGIMGVFTHGIKLTDRAEQTQDLNMAAESLMEEIRLRPFQDPVSPVFGLETGETAGNKSTYDDVDDFCGYTEYPVLDHSGAVNPTLDGIQLRVKVWHLPATDADGQSDTDGSTANDNGEILFNLNASAPSNACSTPGTASRFKAIEVTATSLKYSTTSKNVSPLILRTIRFL